MLGKAKDRLQPYKKNYYFDLNLGSVYNLHFGKSRFDFLFNNYMLDLLPEKDFVPILKSFHHTLKPGGTLIICSMSFPEKWYQKHWLFLAEHFPDLLNGCRPISLVSSLEEAGFTVEKRARSVSLRSRVKVMAYEHLQGLNQLSPHQTWLRMRADSVVVADIYCRSSSTDTDCDVSHHSFSLNAVSLMIFVS